MEDEYMKLQYQLSNGNWIDCGDRTEEFITRCINNNSHLKINTREQIFEALSQGKTLRNDASDWYSNCRDYEAVEKIQAEKKANQKPVEYIKCSCGHTVPRIQAMHASLGTSCPDCYDRLSD
jgi:hypothetical protein